MRFHFALLAVLLPLALGELNNNFYDPVDDGQCVGYQEPAGGAGDFWNKEEIRLPVTWRSDSGFKVQYGYEKDITIANKEGEPVDHQRERSSSDTNLFYLYLFKGTRRRTSSFT